MVIPWRPVLAGLALVAAFAAGRYTAAEPERHEEDHLAVSTTAVTKTVYVARKETAEAKRVVIYRERTTLPDGTKHEREKEESLSVTHQNEEQLQDQEHQQQQQIEQSRKLTLTPAQPHWTVTVMVGATVQLQPALSLAPTYGGSIQYRVAGPFSVGVWGLSSGQFGVAGAVQW